MSAGFDRYSPFAFVDEVVMAMTKRHKLVEVCWAAVFERDDVVDLAPVERDFAPIEPAGVMHSA